MDRELLRRRRRLEVARDRFTVDESDSIAVRDDVHASWARCAGHLTSELTEAPVDGDEVGERWEASPIRRAAGDLIAELQRVADDGDFVAAVTDETGRIVWSWGGRSMARIAERVNFVTGGRWDEHSAGTNAPGLALVTGEPTTVFAVEHWCAAVQDWVCYAAPVRGPDGRPIGVLDLSTTWRRATPLGLTTVAALARLVEQQVRAQPSVGASAATLQLRVLGTGSVALDSLPLLVPLRQLEILLVLATRGHATLDELHAFIYGDRTVSLTTLKAEISHLRRAVGGAIASRPYRLTATVDADCASLLGKLRRGDVSGAVDDYRGQLLPRSEAPFVIEHRHHIDVALRTAVLRWGAAADLLRFAEVHPFDVEVLERAGAVVAPDDPCLADIAAGLSWATVPPGQASSAIG
jgi:hypothetical protein